MKISELIVELQKLDPELTVFVSGYEGGYDYASINGSIDTYALDVNNDTWFYGDHEKFFDESVDEYSDKVKVKGICL